MRDLRRRHPAHAIALIAIGIWVAIAPARAQQPASGTVLEAAKHYDAGMDHFRKREYAAAIDEFRKAHALDSRRETLFAQAQATRLGGDCPAAVELYEKFLATNPPPRQVEATRLALSRCEHSAQPPGPQPTVTNPAVDGPLSAAVASSPPASAADLHPRWYRDRIGGALLVASVVTGGVAVGFLVAARDSARSADGQTSYPAVQQRQDQAQTRWRWGVGALVAGSALILGAAGRYVWIDMHSEGAGVTAGGRF